MAPVGLSMGDIKIKGIFQDLLVWFQEEEPKISKIKTLNSLSITQVSVGTAFSLYLNL